ncbi:MAG TPA: Lrp/AsnC ligand binding domain-containing protein [Nitrososphaeraceae archaeon]
MITALVLINCHFPFDKQILEKLKSFSEITNIYRTQGVYDLIVKITSSSEEEFREVMTEISRVNKVNSTVTLTIVEKQKLIVQAN